MCYQSSKEPMYPVFLKMKSHFIYWGENEFSVDNWVSNMHMWGKRVFLHTHMDGHNLGNVKSPISLMCTFLVCRRELKQTEALGRIDET